MRTCSICSENWADCIHADPWDGDKSARFKWRWPIAFVAAVAAVLMMMWGLYEVTVQ